MIIPVLTGSGDIISSVVLWFELNVAGSRLPPRRRGTASSAQKS